MKGYTILVIVIIVTMAFLSQEAMGQINPPPNNSSQSIPLDPLSWVLLAAGGGVAANKYRKSKMDK